MGSEHGRQATRTTDNGEPRPKQIQWSRHHAGWIYFRDGKGLLAYARSGASELASLLTGGPGRAGSESVAVPFEAKMTIRRDEEFGEMFEQSWRGLAEHFYDAKFHGIDWEGVRTAIVRWSSISP